jgi:hypothetical protein
MKLDNQTIVFAFIVVTGLLVLAQTVMLLLIFTAVRKAANAIHEEAENLRTSLMPVIFDTRDLLAKTQGVLANTQEFVSNAQGLVIRVTPRIESATADIVEITHRLREQTAEMQLSAVEIMERVRRQSSRVDEMFSHLLDTLDYAGGFVAETVSKPVRQVSGILRAAKAIVQTLRTPVNHR